MWHTNLPPRADWVHETVHSNVGLSPQEKVKAENGLKYAPPVTHPTVEPHVPDTHKETRKSSSAMSSLSSSSHF